MSESPPSSSDPEMTTELNEALDKFAADCEAYGRKEHTARPDLLKSRSHILSLFKRGETVFSIAELAELCSVTDGTNVVHDVLSDPLRAKLVQMWNEQSRASLQKSAPLAPESVSVSEPGNLWGGCSINGAGECVSEGFCIHSPRLTLAEAERALLGIVPPRDRARLMPQMDALLRMVEAMSLTPDEADALIPLMCEKDWKPKGSALFAKVVRIRDSGESPNGR